MLDFDFAELYEVETRVLNQAVKRNRERFPKDFLIEPNSSELADLRSQFVTLGLLTHENHVFKYAPYLFTENGVAMLSSILRSKEAIQVNITIMRTFTRLRSFLSMESSLTERMGKLEKTTNHLFKVVFERLDTLDEAELPKFEHPHDRKKIGLKPKSDLKL